MAPDRVNLPIPALVNNTLLPLTIPVIAPAPLLVIESVLPAKPIAAALRVPVFIVSPVSVVPTAPVKVVLPVVVVDKVVAPLTVLVKLIAPVPVVILVDAPKEVKPKRMSVLVLAIVPAKVVVVGAVATKPPVKVCVPPVVPKLNVPVLLKVTALVIVPVLAFNARL